MRRRSRKYLIFITFLLFLSSYISSSFIFAYFREVYFPEYFDTIRKLIFADDISCYQTNDSFVNAIYEPNSIFFYQTNCHHTLSLRESCSIESMAKIHPSQNVYIIFVNSIKISDPVIKKIQTLKNVQVSRININNYADGTPIYDLPDIIGRGKRRYKAMADLLKVITLYKYGGTVLDSDIIVAKPLDRLGDNWLVREDGFSLSMLKLSNDLVGRATAGMILSKFQTEADHGYVNLKNAIMETMNDLCTASKVKNRNNDTCSGFYFYNGRIFHPISYEQRDWYLRPGNLKDSFAYQTWLPNTKSIPKDSLYSLLARTYCPQIFSEFMYDFVSDY